MRYGYFDNEHREYVIDRVDVPVSWTNYIGLKDMYGVFNHTAGGYLLYKTPEYHRITRFRPNGVPMDGPGHYAYIRDDDTGDFWTVSWHTRWWPMPTTAWKWKSTKPPMWALPAGAASPRAGSAWPL